MPDSLCTFTPLAGAAINLGNQDAWVEVVTDDSTETYKVHGYYLRNEVADPKDGTTPAAVRTAAEVYFKTLVQALGITQADILDLGGTEYLVPRIGAVSGTLANPYTGLSVAGLYLTDASQEDDGWRGFDFELTFVKQRTYAAPQTCAFDPDGATANTTIGNNTSYIIKSRDAFAETWTVMTSYTATTRAAAETYAASLAALFLPRELVSTETPTGPQLVPHASALKGVLTNPKTALSESNVYCISIEHDDKGSLTYGLTVVFQRSLYALIADPATDTRVAKYKGVTVGNRPALILVTVDEPALYAVVVRSQYVGSDCAIYADALATAIALEPVFTALLPRGGAGYKAAIRSYLAVAGTLSCPAVLAADITALFANSLRVSLRQETNTVDVELTLSKSR